MGGETAQAWRVVLDDLIKRGLRKPEFLIVDGGSGLERALAELWSDVPTQRRTVHKHRNLLAHAPERRLLAAIRQASRLREEVTADYMDDFAGRNQTSISTNDFAGRDRKSVV